MNKTTRDAIVRELKAAQGIAEIAEAENRDLTTEDRAKIAAHVTKADELKKNAADDEALRKQLAELSDDIGLNAPEAEPVKPAGFDRPAKGQSTGHAFVASPEYKALMASVPNGKFSEKARVQSQPYGVKTLLTGTDHDTGAGSLVPADLRGLLDPFYQRPLTIRDLVSPGQTTSDTVEYVRLVSTTNNAAPVPEATSTAVIDGTTVTEADGGLKPESGMAFEKDSTTVKTLAHWIPATKRALSDAAQIRTLIDTFLRYGLDEVLEDQIVDGDGSGENFLGIAHVSGVQTQTAPGSGEDVFDVTRRARRKIRIGGRTAPTAYVMNPIDWENVELLRNTQGNFYGNGPFAMTTPTLWGLPVVESEAIAAGTAWVANWKMAVLYDREQASIQVTDSHADFFVRNLVAILAELRAAFAVLRPAAFCKITLA
jgi:HK97 family phage major capsid protein